MRHFSLLNEGQEGYFTQIFKKKKLGLRRRERRFLSPLCSSSPSHGSLAIFFDKLSDEVIPSSVSFLDSLSLTQLLSTLPLSPFLCLPHHLSLSLNIHSSQRSPRSSHLLDTRASPARVEQAEMAGHGFPATQLSPLALMAVRGKAMTPCRAPPSSGKFWWPTWVEINSSQPLLRNRTLHSCQKCPD